MVSFSDDRDGRKDGLYGITQKKINSFIHASQLNITHIPYTYAELENDQIFKDNKTFMLQSADYSGRSYKPLIIKRTLELMKDGDLLIYTDCSPELFSIDIDKIKPELFSFDSLSNLLNLNRGFLALECYWDPYSDRKNTNNWKGMHVHELFTLNRCMKYMNCEKYEHCLMCASGVLLMKKKEFVVNLIDEWLKYNLIPDCASLGPSDKNTEYWREECDKKFGHRHDQSIISLLMNKYDLHVLNTDLYLGNPYFAFNYFLKSKTYTTYSTIRLPPPFKKIQIGYPDIYADVPR